LGGGGDTPGDTPDEGEPRDPVTPTPGGPGDIGDGPGTPGDGGPGTPGDGGPGDGGNVPGDTALPPGWTRAGDGGAIGPDGRWHPRAPGGTHNTVVPYDRSSERPEYVVNMPFQMAGTSHLWRGQGWNLNTTDLRTEGSSFQNAKRTLDRQPVVFRTEGFAPQNDAGDYQYTQRPFLSRVQGGTAATGAGVWSMPPVFAIEDYRDGAPSTSITYATTYRGFAPGVNVAFGLPNATQAVSDGGHTMGHNVTDSTLEISGIASGTISPVLRANAEEVFLAAPSTAAADGDISSNEVVFYVNDTDETLHAKGKDGDGDVIDVRLGQTICLQSYLELNQRSSEPENIHGGLQALSLADTLSNGDSITVTKGVGKIVLLVIAANDAVGDITVTGTSVDRDTGAETGSDTDTLTMTKISTDNSTTDAEGNAVFSWDDALITSKWFTGSVVLSTTTVDLTDVDVYAISFEQWNDTDTVVETFDVTAESTNTAAWAYWYLYSVIPGTGDLVDITTIASVEASDADTTASGAPALWRLRRGNLDTSLTGATDGIFIQAHLGPNNLTYWNDVTTKVWGRQ